MIVVPLHVSTDGPRKTSRGHIRRPKPAIYEARVSVDTMADISESIDVRRSDGSMRIEKRFVWSTVQRSGYPTTKVVIGGCRANHMRAQSRSHSIVGSAPNIPAITEDAARM